MQRELQQIRPGPKKVQSRVVLQFGLKNGTLVCLLLGQTNVCSPISLVVSGLSEVEEKSPDDKISTVNLPNYGIKV